MLCFCKTVLYLCSCSCTELITEFTVHRGNCAPDCAPNRGGCNVAFLARLVTAAVVEHRGVEAYSGDM